MLAIPILAGAGSAGMAGLLGKATGFSRSPRNAPTFYSLVLLGTLGGAAFSLLGVNPIRLLVFVAALNGVAAAPFLPLRNDGLIWPHRDGFIWPHLRPTRSPPDVKATVLGLGESSPAVSVRR